MNRHKSELFTAAAMAALSEPDSTITIEPPTSTNYYDRLHPWNNPPKRPKKRKRVPGRV